MTSSKKNNCQKQTNKEQNTERAYGTNERPQSIVKIEHVLVLFKHLWLFKTLSARLIQAVGRTHRSPYISLKNKLGHFDERYKHFSFGDHFINSHNLYFL